MKTSLIRISALALMLSGTMFFAQDDESMPVTTTEVNTPSLREYLAPQKYNRNVFEDPKVEPLPYDGVRVSVGGDFTAQYQALKHETKATLAPGRTLNNQGKNFNLPTANLDVNAYLAKGVKLHMRTYLSARHHNEAWVKGGYMQIDNLDFIQEGFMSDVMKHVRLKAGYDDLNYGDTHFRRSDNGYALSNPFVGNYIMDSFTTQPFVEGYLFYNNFFGMLGLSNGKLNQSVVKNATSDNKPSYYAKVGYDKQVDNDLRVRISGSVLKTNGMTSNGKLYGDDRAGSRYYYVLLLDNDATGTSNAQTGRFNPGLMEMTAFQLNPFVKYQGLEFFGVLEHVRGNKLVNPTTKRDTNGSYTQIGAELLYRFGGKEQFYAGGRYNGVSGEDWDNAGERKISRVNVGGGWFVTPNILTKVEYVQQKYNESNAWGIASPLYGGKFKGVVLEASIGF